MKAVHLLELVVLGMLLTSCVVRPKVDTPEAAVQGAVTRDAQGVVAAHFRVLATRPWQGGVIVIYTLADVGDLTDVELDDMHLSFVEREQGTWQVRGSSRATGTLPQGRFVDYAVGSGFTRTGSYRIVYGRAHVAEVAAVEVVFSNHQTVRDTIAGPVFIATTSMYPEATIPCELRVLNEQNKVIQQVPLAARPPGNVSSPQLDGCGL